MLTIPAIIQPGSRVNWKLLLAGTSSSLEKFKTWSKNHLDDSEQLLMANDSNRELKSSVLRLKYFLGLSSMAAMLLAGIALPWPVSALQNDGLIVAP